MIKSIIDGIQRNDAMIKIHAPGIVC
jgi:hypothetical protein